MRGAELSSRPTRACGLKLEAIEKINAKQEVTPHTGVWIETIFPTPAYALTQVTPHTGVWIETLLVDPIEEIIKVTPHTGVWIETFVISVKLSRKLCHAPHGRVD